MAPARSVGKAFFPLDEELGLLGTGLTPRAEGTLVRLASWMPFEQAREVLNDLVGVQVSKATARRATLGAGRAALVLLEEEAQRLKRELPQAPAGAAKQAMSADGAMVPLVGGEWGEVKTLVLGEVTRNTRGDVCTQQLSSFSRLSTAERFEEAALVETHRRGVEKATAVCAVQDGAEWLTGLVDYHVRMRCASWTLLMLPSISVRWGKRPSAQTARCWTTGWASSCMHSSMKVPARC